MEKEQINFEKELARLNEIVSLIQENEISLDESMKLYEEGNAIVKKLETALKEAENKVETIVEVNKKNSSKLVGF